MGECGREKTGKGKRGKGKRGKGKRGKGKRADGQWWKSKKGEKVTMGEREE